MGVTYSSIKIALAQSKLEVYQLKKKLERKQAELDRVDKAIDKAIVSSPFMVCRMSVFIKEMLRNDEETAHFEEFSEGC